MSNPPVTIVQVRPGYFIQVNNKTIKSANRADRNRLAKQLRERLYGASRMRYPMDFVRDMANASNKWGCHTASKILDVDVEIIKYCRKKMIDMGLMKPGKRGRKASKEGQIELLKKTKHMLQEEIFRLQAQQSKLISGLGSGSGSDAASPTIQPCNPHSDRSVERSAEIVRSLRKSSGP